jgi:preprotein translocase subunit SecD
MKQNLQWKLITIVGVLVIFAGVGVYPIVAGYAGLPVPGWLASKQLKLGLDLKGGVHLVLRVKTDEALAVETDTVAARVREGLTAASITSTRVARTTPTSFVVEGVPSAQDATFRQAVVDAEASYDRSAPSNGTYTFTMKPNIERSLRAEAVVQARETMGRRVDELGVAEPIIAQQGADGDQILVQLPGVTDINRAKQIIGSPGLLELKLVEQGPFGTEAEARTAYNNNIPPDLMIVPGTSDGSAGAPGSTVYWVVRQLAAVSGRDLRGARTTLDTNNRPAVSFTLSNDGARRFALTTEQNIGRYLAIVLDGRVESAPRIEGRIADQGQIYGNYTPQEAADLSIKLRSGALPAGMEYLEEQTIGPTLGADSIRSGVMASVGGLVLVMLFMLGYYRLAGFNALTSILVNLIILLGMMAYLGAVMTLPGFAGFILTIGIGVDSNVLIFERIKEELAAGRPVRTAVNAGFDRVWWTIVDTHVASLIAAVFLFNFGTGPIRGFATSLMIGLAANVFTAVFVSRTMFEVVLTRRREATLSI